MDEQIYFNGIKEYLIWYLNIPAYTALDIVSCMDDYSNPKEILEINLEDYLVKEVIEKLKIKINTHPIKSYAFLLGLSFPNKIVDLIINHYGSHENLINMIKDNPYNLMFVEGISFLRIDKIALEKLYFDKEDPKRLEAIVLYHLESYCNKNGHLYVNLETFIRSKFKIEINKKNIKLYLKKLILDKKLILEGKKLYTLKNYNFETISAKIIAKKILNKEPSNFFKNVDAEKFIKGYEEKHTLSENKSFNFSKQQKEVIKNFLKERFLVITGLPGTGKTLITKALLNISRSQGLNVCLMAPTGIAAKRISKTCDYKANTIHKELCFDGISWGKGENNPIEYDVIIVDEFSMVDQQLFYQLLISLPKKEHILVIIGDDAQLQSVAPGNVLRELILSNKIPHVRLTEIFRQKDTSDIVLNAHLINQGKSNLVSDKKDFIFFQINNENTILDNIIKIVENLEDKEINYQVLSPTYKGTLGVININIVLQEILNESPTNVFFKTNNYNFKIEDKIMITRNDYLNNVYNGEQGIITNIDKISKKITVLINGKKIEYSFKDAYSSLTLDYCRTIHKSQGTEYDVVILPFVRGYSIQLQRNLLYTAITRAKRKVYMLGHNQALYKAIRNNNVSKRNTVFSSRILLSIEDILKNKNNI